jgi:hypothetical protein
MKILYPIFASILIFTACSSDEDVLSPFEKVNYRVIAYQSLTEDEAATLINDWRTAPVSAGKYRKENNNHIIIMDENIKWHFRLNDSETNLNDNQSLITVAFNTKDDPLLGPLIIIINPENDIVVGAVLRL